MSNSNNSNKKKPEAVKDISVSSSKSEEKKSINNLLGKRTKQSKMNVSTGNIVTIFMSKQLL